MAYNRKPEFPTALRRSLDYRAVWRWHFYAGLFCIPFVVLLAITGSIYLFKPQIESWLESPYDHLKVTGRPATAEAQVAAALAAVPGARLNSYELPVRPDSAVRVLVGKGTELYRVYVHPETTQVLHQEVEDLRPMELIFRLHGEMLLGNRGSMIVELAASWAVLMILTGIFLWWPRGDRGFAGILYPRLRSGGRIFWRDIHSVVGLWVSVFTLFLILSGLPWAKSWGNLLKTVRKSGSQAVAQMDWSTGSDSELAKRVAMNTDASPEKNEHAGHEGHGGAMNGSDSAQKTSYASIDRLVTTVSPLHLAPPVLIAPPSKKSSQWTAKSDSQNRPLRTNLVLDGASGAVISREDFSQRPFIDRLVGIGIAAHEGHLFGIMNQLLGLFTALGLVTVSISAVVMWWQRRPVSELGAPRALAHPRAPVVVLVLMSVLGLVFPMLGLSMIGVLGLEFFVFRRIAATRKFLGLCEEGSASVN